MIEWLEKWYLEQCDGDWEHIFGIEVYTIDNPGWHVKINLEDTLLENKPFDTYRNCVNENDWIICQVKENIFYAAGDPLKLEKIIEIFKKWVES